ncbi:SigB/SigF/SigG family RNA polymerase sigma factor [Mycolicibacterium sediminis]|nr:SigB/SigF/SigG family RNA polymerase sigma factor [Mycolicibacterium sediminis]
MTTIHTIDVEPAVRVAPERTNDNDEYADVIDMFRVLNTLDEDSPAFRRQRDAIVTRCLPLAEHIARHYDRRGEDLEDLTQIARLGLVNAVKRFDPEKGAGFLSFAVPTMMGEVRRHFRDHGWAMHVPRRLKDRHVQLTRAMSDMTQSLGRAPTPSELAEYLGIDRQDVVESLVASAAYRTHSIDAPMGGGDDGDARMLQDTVGGPDPAFARITDQESVRPLIAALPERERTILYLRFFDSMTQSQIAERIGVSQMHVSRILERTLKELRGKL